MRDLGVFLLNRRHQVPLQGGAIAQVARINAPWGPGDHENGAFNILLHRQALHVIASRGDGWDHVSASRSDRIPLWTEMCAVKELFFDDDECVIQYHPPRQQYVNCHKFCLHLWKPTAQALPLPPSWMVGPRDGQSIEDALREAGGL